MVRIAKEGKVVLINNYWLILKHCKPYKLSLSVDQMESCSHLEGE